jgi:RHS repeat-associated protein
LPPGIARQETLPPGLGGTARGQGQGLETAPGQQPEPQSPQSAQGEQQQAAKQIVVDVRTDADRQAVTGQATNAVSSGELPGEFLYFFHPDHLGSTSYVTDDKGAVYEHLQYFPFGETWVQEGQPSQRIPYLFTSKELDEETGLYYFGARYYDPRTSLWVSADPAVEKYFPKLVDQLAAEKAGNKFDPEKRLPAGGGVFSSVNLGLYSYSANSPLTIVDPNGLWGIKAGVQMQEVQPRMTKLEALVDAIFQKHAGRDAIVTSGTEGKHTVVNSLHYVGLALDLRSNDIKSEKAKDSILNELKEELGPDFDVLLEFRGEGREHFHIEFQPTTQNSGDAGTDPMSSPVVLEPTSNDVTSAVQKFEQHTE